LPGAATAAQRALLALQGQGGVPADNLTPAQRALNDILQPAAPTSRKAWWYGAMPANQA
jgi:hypothetical protein